MRSKVLRVEKNALLMYEKLWGEIYICNSPDRKIMSISPPFKIILADCGQRENLLSLHASWGFPGGKESACQGRRCGFSLWVGKIPWRRKWKPTLVFLPGKSHGQRSLVGYSPWGHRIRHDWAQHTHASHCIIHCSCSLTIPSQASITLVYSFHDIYWMKTLGQNCVRHWDVNKT